MYKIIIFVLIPQIIFFGCTNQNRKIKIIYPKTIKEDIVDVYFGTEVQDPYRWLEDDLSEKTKHWIEEQNKVTFGYIKKIPFRKSIENRLTQLYNYERESAPTVHGKYEYYYKNNGLQNQSILYRRLKGEIQEEVFIDPNSFSKDGTISLGGTYFTHDGSLMVYLISIGGSDWKKGIVIDTETKQIINDTLHNLKFSNITWKENEGFFYSSYVRQKNKSELSAKTSIHKLYYHKLRTLQTDDQVVFGNGKETFRYVGAYIVNNNPYLFISAANKTSGSVLYIKSLKTPNAPIINIDSDMDTEEDVKMIHNNMLYIYTNKNAPNKKLIAISIDKLNFENAKVVIPEGEYSLSISTGGNYIFAHYLIDAKTSVFQFDTKGNLVREVKLPGIGTASGFSSKPEEKEIYYTFKNFTKPNTIYKYNVETGKSELYKHSKIDFNSDDYITKQIFYKSKDGTKIPMFIVHKKGLKKNGKTPTMLYSYGGFNISLKPKFSPSILYWIEQGGIYAQPNIRGGGEYGDKWHISGTKMNKQNVFDDFIAAAEYLIKNNYTSSEYLAISGRSNGGLLVGAVMTQRPDLMKVALPGVGVLDMLRYHTFTAGAGWAYDYGTSEDSKEMFKYLLAYSPVHNVKQNINYPATLVTTADHDDRVVPAHSFKFISALQDVQQGENPVLIRIETNAGHGAGTPIKKTIKTLADIYAFTFYNMNYTPKSK